MEKFPCNACGACCKQVGKVAEGKRLDRGDGICVNFDTNTKLCTIYENRPDICRVDVQFLTRYSKNMDWDTFVVLNLEACKFIQDYEESLVKIIKQNH